jgi:NACHT domain
VLTSRIIDHVQTKTLQQETGLAYFYCARAEPERSDAAEILRCIVRQLSFCDVGRPLRAAALEAYSRKRMEADEQRVSLEKLNVDECVKIIVALLKDDPAFIILDGLDECERTQKQEILHALQLIIEESPMMVKIVLSSRDEYFIRVVLVGFPGLYISSIESQALDIELYIEAQIQRALQTKRLLGGRATRPLINQIANTLGAKPQQT